MVAFAAAVMNMSVCSAVQHVVGDDRGWDPTGQDFQGWASRRIFRVGDNLWFAYASSQQSVLELKSKEDFEKCDLRNPLRLYDGGLDAVALVKVGRRYFSSGREEDCRNGMKLWINVISNGMENGSDNFDVVSDGTENHGADHHYSNLVSDRMEKLELNNFKLVSGGMDNWADNWDLTADGKDNGYSQGLGSSDSLVSSALNYLMMERMEAAEGPAVSVTSGAVRFAYSFLFLCFGCFTATLHVMI